jgi:lysozyme
MKISQAGINLIKHFEGFYPKPYICPAGYLTVGYGHLVKDKTLFNKPLTEAEAEALLRQDVLQAENGVNRLIKRPLTAGQFDALVSFTFNLGAGALQRSTLRRKVNSGYDTEVPAEFAKWVWGGGKKLPGLIKRRAAEAQMYQQGIA